MYISTPKIGEELTCPVCLDNFKVVADTKYICCGGYVCSWQCFLDYTKNFKKPIDKTK